MLMSLKGDLIDPSNILKQVKSRYNTYHVIKSSKCFFITYLYDTKF